MSKWNRLLRVLTILVGAISIGVITHQIVSLAGYKLFWFDEGNEILNSCAKSYSYTLIHGALSQCSPAPLYYVLQKFVVTHVPLNGENILYFFRAISIVSAVLSLVVLFFGFTKYLGIAWGLFALLLMNNQGIFHTFGAENRPYMLWLFVFSATLIIVSCLVHIPWNQVTIGSKINLAFLALALTLVAGGGMFQTVGFLATFFIWEESMKVRQWLKHPSFKPLFLVAAVSCALGIYYAVQGCLQYDGLKWDLLRTGDWTLVGKVMSLLWPPPQGTGFFTLLTTRDWTLVRRAISLSWPIQGVNLVNAVPNFFVLAAVAAPFWLWNTRKNLPEGKKFVLSVCVVSIIQICCAVILGVLVATAHYYFVTRVFIYLIVLRAVLVVCGGYLCLSWMLEKWNKSSCNSIRQSLFQVSLIAVAVLGLSVSLYGSHKALGNDMRVFQSNWPALIHVSCPPMKSSLAVISREEHAIKGREEYGLNFIAIFGEQLKACGWVPGDGPPSYVVPKRSPDGKTYSYQITENLPVGSSILGFFHRPLSFEQ
jgi:hypothetical protein